MIGPSVLVRHGAVLSFNLFLILLTLAGLVAGWVMHMIFDETEDGPSYWQTLIYPGRYPPGRYRWTFVLVFLAIGGIGAWYLP
jgi:hypothetical protein